MLYHQSEAWPSFNRLLGTFWSFLWGDCSSTWVTLRLTRILNQATGSQPAPSVGHIGPFSGVPCEDQWVRWSFSVCWEKKNNQKGVNFTSPLLIKSSMKRNVILSSGKGSTTIDAVTTSAWEEPVSLQGVELRLGRVKTRPDGGLSLLLKGGLRAPFLNPSLYCLGAVPVLLAPLNPTSSLSPFFSSFTQ